MLGPCTRGQFPTTPPYGINVVGSTGSGKTTFARMLAARLDIPHVELDSLHWQPNWVAAPKAVFHERIRAALSVEQWVVDGNYSAARAIVWERANVIVWLDYPLRLILYRLAKRTFKRVVFRQELWNGNREGLGKTFSRDSIFWWALTTYDRKRQEFPALFAQPQYADLVIIHLQSSKACQQWLKNLHDNEKIKV